MESELSYLLHSVVSRLNSKEPLESQTHEVDDYYRSRLSTSPADAECGDSPGDHTEDMAIDELNWEEDASIAPKVISLPPPPNYSDLNDPIGADTPSLNSDLEPIFNSDPNNDVLETTTPGVCGLSNLGNTCFMNSGLQCLLNTPPLVNSFVTLAKENSNTDTLATHFANLFQKVWSGKYSKVKPTEFQQALANQHCQFKDYRQHDCQEFLALLLGSLHELLNTASSKSQVSDLSADPTTPRSVSEELAVATDDPVDDSASQVGSRCEASSSSSRSSESSLGHSQMRFLPIPANTPSFKGPQSPMWSVGGRDWSGSELIEDGPAAQTDKETKLNNQQSRFFDNIYKDAKTSNINVLSPDPVENNGIILNSDKFPKHEKNRRRNACEFRNLTENHDFDGKTTCAKRYKDTNRYQENSSSTLNKGSELFSYNNKRFKTEDGFENDKNIRMELDRSLRDEEKSNDDDDAEFAGAVAAADILDDDLASENQWEKHLGLNQSIIVESFQGQFKSTVVCSECRFTSSTYEPFMYLSVPLPHAMEQQLRVTFVPASSAPPTKLLLTINKQHKVLQMKQQLREILDLDENMPLEIAQVLQHHIACIMDENRPIRSIAGNDPLRSLYAFEISDEITFSSKTDIVAAPMSPEPLDLTPDQVNIASNSKLTQLNNQDVPNRKQNDHKVSSLKNNFQLAGCSPNHGNSISIDKSEENKTCAICLENGNGNLKSHPDCSCCLCDDCIERSVSYYTDNNKNKNIVGGLLECPVCRAEISVEDFVDAEDKDPCRSKVKMLLVPVLFRQDFPTEDTKHTEELFGHPHLIKVANRLAGSTLYKLISNIVPYNSNYNILLVNAQGHRCCRCPFSSKCKGCRVPENEEEVILSSEYNLAVHFLTPVVVENNPVDHSSLRNMREHESLDLYDCLNAFCESETLDEHNPWYCPKCERYQCATKTLSVSKYPDFLIVYLKRFVFYEYASVKLDNRVSFPFHLSASMPPTDHSNFSERYDLYACVNHLGGASGGHYTAYAKNPRTEDWHFFNDDTVIAQKPQESDYNHAYILFYHKRDTQPPNTMLTSFLGSGNIKAHIDLIESKNCLF